MVCGSCSAGGCSHQRVGRRGGELPINPPHAVAVFLALLAGAVIDFASGCVGPGEGLERRGFELPMNPQQAAPAPVPATRGTYKLLTAATAPPSTCMQRRGCESPTHPSWRGACGHGALCIYGSRAGSVSHSFHRRPTTEKQFASHTGSLRHVQPHEATIAMHKKQLARIHSAGSASSKESAASSQHPTGTEWCHADLLHQHVLRHLQQVAPVDAAGEKSRGWASQVPSVRERHHAVD